MKLLVIDESYPHEKNLPGDMFVHVRLKKYAVRHSVQVISLLGDRQSLSYEGIPIEVIPSQDEVVEEIKKIKPDVILIHFFQSWMLSKIIKVTKIPIVVWVHGYEATGWYRRLFNFKRFDRLFLISIYQNMLQQFYFRKLIQHSNKNKKTSLIFVSNWLKKTVEVDTLAFVKNGSVIPNPIDTQFFMYRKKEKEVQRKVLIIRSFESKKYANDQSVEAILKLSKHPAFHEWEFTIVGNGRLFDSLTAPLKNFKNVKITKAFVNQEKIKALHGEHGIFLCPTRQDSHGVSMCEAMSSGLVPVTSNNSAIPESVIHDVSGLLTDDADEIAQQLLRLSHDDELFQKLSMGAAKSIRDKYSFEDIIQKELNVIEKHD